MPIDGNGRETGWISPNAFQSGALSADSIGREAMADGYVTAAKLASDVTIRAKVGIYDLDFYNMAVYG